MDPNSESRIIKDLNYPKLVFGEALLIFLGANYFFFKNIFKIHNNRVQLISFIFVNAFTSMNMAELIHFGTAKYYAGLYNNWLEVEHRKVMNEQLQNKLVGKNVINPFLSYKKL